LISIEPDKSTEREKFLSSTMDLQTIKEENNGPLLSLLIAGFKGP
jgi:hypothetical protein